jgi:beta-phosphoglucomutase
LGLNKQTNNISFIIKTTNTIMPIKACLFDLDGVIVDTAVYHFKAWRRLANELGFDFTEQQNEQLKGISRMESLDLILSWGNVQLSSEEKNQWAARKNNWYLDLVQQMTPQEILPGVVDFLNELKEQKIAIVLGSASKNSKLILNKIDLLHYFDAIIDGNNISKGKPDPEVFQLGAEAVAATPSQCIVFEDAQAGIQAALAAGMYTVGIGAAKTLAQAHLVFEKFTDFNWAILQKEFE